MSNDVQITVVNRSQDELTLVVFQQDTNIDQMFDKVFPLAWKVFPLNPSTDSKVSQGHTIYPIQQGIGVTRNAMSSDALPFGDLDITQLVDDSQQLEYTIDGTGAQDLTLLATKNVDPSVSCLNSSGQRAQMALYKNGSVVVAQPNVASGDQALFLLTPKIYFLWTSDMVEGTLFKSYQEGANVQEYDLTGVSQVTATVITAGPGGAKKWQITSS